MYAIIGDVNKVLLLQKNIGIQQSHSNLVEIQAGPNTSCHTCYEIFVYQCNHKVDEKYI